MGQLQATQSSSTAASAAVTDAASRKVQQLEARARQQEQHIQELHVDSHELHAQADAARREAAIAHKQLRESREAFRTRIEHFALEVSHLQSNFRIKKGQCSRPDLATRNVPQPHNRHAYILKAGFESCLLCMAALCSAVPTQDPCQMQSLQCFAALLQVGDLHRAVQLAASDPGSDLAPSHADFADRVKQLVEQLHQVQAQKDADAAHALREAQQQHSLMRGRMQALHDGYRRLRHRVEDQVGPASGPGHVAYG